MTVIVIMLAGFALFLMDRKWSRIALLCLVPVCVLTGYLTSANSLAMWAGSAGMLLIAASPVFERAAGVLGERFSLREEPLQASEDDILDNKTKWRLILAGYAVFILFAIFAVISIIRLNAKINTLYGFTQDLDQRIEEVSDTEK